MHEVSATIEPIDLYEIPDRIEPPAMAEPLSYSEVLHATRLWVLYGCGGFAVICILIGAAEALFGR